MFIPIEDTAFILEKLERLNAYTPAVFGKMTAQHMLEHLAFSVMLSNGKRESKLYLPEEKAKAYKSFLLYTDAKIPRGYKAPVLGDEPPPLKFANLDEAGNFMLKQVAIFLEYEKNHAEKLHIHPTLGLLNLQEWHVFHNKHFTHHFEQFGLV